MLQRSSWATRLAAFGSLSNEDEMHLGRLTAGRRAYKAGVEFVETRDAPNRMLVIVAGLACRARLLPDGRRQILSFLFPGDTTSPERLLTRQAGHAVSMLVPSEIALLDRADVEGLQAINNIDQALTKCSIVREAITAEWQVNVGLRTATERIAHLFCEMYSRLESIGHACNHAFRLLLTQTQLADAVALTAVHVNRVLMELRRQKTIAIENGVVSILDFGCLRDIAGFDPGYLQLDAVCQSGSPPVLRQVSTATG